MSISLKLADFGLAMDVKEAIYTVCGTPTYVAPEILSEIGMYLVILIQFLIDKVNTRIFQTNVQITKSHGRLCRAWDLIIDAWVLDILAKASTTSLFFLPILTSISQNSYNLLLFKEHILSSRLTSWKTCSLLFHLTTLQVACCKWQVKHTM